jgi:hypothetical protein
MLFADIGRNKLISFNLITKQQQEHDGTVGMYLGRNPVQILVGVTGYSD